ncbi:hypothetical protein K435DRAFT_666289 [Dendrothele bispora CBS 962.96]|uniref:Zn(2)-C6 fungal-type domain-containing protein n=1 Tax=Dendrothele bispora (strain CBS 962.96) TaxID=1314807 RepID=A0A4S8M0D3_DENBC|nr:hypothetical protein K435DRAFT_689505 [Dendrothele bispora CBS 962.96]THU95482.1 hypothetical protein K435DRAFT_666289 [Dendrothele bispora CBS 962.96]
MANKAASADKVAQGTLQRGKACLRCRKRKMRCDGNKPACQQCTRAKKPEGCEYDDGKGKTRTQILRETITRLEQRIRELEDPEYISPAVVLYDPHLQSESSPSPYGSPGSASISASHSPFPSEETNSPPEQWSHLPPGVPSPTPSPFSTDIFFEEPQSYPTFELEPVLLDIFAPHRHQCGLGISIRHLQDSLSMPPEKQRHPALMKSIYLWACFVSRPKPLSQHEEAFLIQALEAHREGLRTGDKVLDIIQASCLLSMYFLANGRIMEGSYHASAAASLAVQCGLQAGIAPPEPGSYNPAASRENLDLKPLKSGSRDAERVATFWMVYNLDRCWSVALRKPWVILDGEDPWTSINCPWPNDIAEYESGNVQMVASFQTVQMFLQGDVSGVYSMPAIRAKASALYSRAAQLSSKWNPSFKFTNDYPEEIQSLELTISRFIPTILPVLQLNATITMPEEKYTLIVVHTLVQTAIIHLHQRFAQNDAIAYEKCSVAAKAAVEIVKYISDQDYDFLDPIIGPAWTTVAEWLIRELVSIESSWPLGSGAEIRNDIATLLYAMNGLNHRFPLLGKCL